MQDSRKRPHKPTAEERLLAHGQRYNFFVSVSMLERLTPGAVRVGGEGPYAREAIRFRHAHDLVFNAGELGRIERVRVPHSAEQVLDEERYRYEVTTAFMGVSGAMTPMPLYIAEEVCQDDDGARIKRDFLDLFHHRLVSLVYRIGIKFDFAREHTQGANDAWSRRMLAMAGFDAYDGWRMRHLSRSQLLRLAPLLSSKVRSAHTLALAVQDVTSEALQDATVHVVQFTGDWTLLDPEQRISLGLANSEVGINAVLGVECFHRAGKATIVIGPLRENFRRFLADGDMFPAICELVGMLSPEPIEYELDLVLVDRPPFLLGKKEGGRVGFDSWLSSRAAQRGQTHLKVPLPKDLLRVTQREVGSGTLAPSASAARERP
ncbi:type VI secretion system baseplate subunit TssG [Paraliomyxa miuraensis]|uniref:type VI secretion system baseplate subunit TssG n=1 Tax=Paraliomyxa miuraensis TaxID=376150 RepID=UPI002255E8E9|nr:type VI secretion system baseplate subunit TssG [Paraliomyxa miuraensis]MCX4243018.1 type VI secretion system baseplate subunit TssG [Paraliomyxa miuraensis]